MRNMLRESFKLSALVALWLATVALRALFTQPYELFWFVGIIAAFFFAATVGYIWRGLKPARDAARRRRAAYRE